MNELTNRRTTESSKYDHIIEVIASPVEYSELFHGARGCNLDPSLVKAIISAESSWKEDAVRYEPVLKRAFIAAKKACLILVCAAGNEATPETQEQDIDTIGYPARFASEGLCISVGAIDPNMNLADFSSTGQELLFVAPGVDVTSTWPRTSYATLSGTSFSTPIIAGVCALAIAKHRKYGGATPINGLDDMAEHLKKISHDLGVAGKDNWFGYGIPKFLEGKKGD